MSRCDRTDPGSPALKLHMTGRGEDAMRMEKRLRCAGRALGVDVQVEWDASGILMLRAPTGVSLEEVRSAVCAVPGVVSIHHLHLWEVAEHDIHFEGHIVLDDQPLRDSEGIRLVVEALLHERFDINHSTLQIEPVDGQCATAELA